MTHAVKISRDLSEVGPQKPVGYELLRNFADYSQADMDGLVRRLEKKGLKVLILKDAECVMRSGALYAYHERALSAHLKKRAAVLAAGNWPTEPEAFVRKLALEWTPEKTPLFDTIADAFNNKAHPGRTDIKVPAQDEHYSQQYLSCLREKEKHPGKNGPACKPP